jgi:outer membrane receptor protein involved in Fe transport
MVDLHVDGDVGIGDLVFASTYWSQPSSTVDEYSNYVQYSTISHFTAPFIQSFACLTDPISSGGTQGFTGCNVPYQYYTYNSNSNRYSNELRLESKPGGSLHWVGGAYWEKTHQDYSVFFAMPGLQPTGEAYTQQIAYYNSYYHATARPLPNEWYSYVSRFDYLETTEFGDLTWDLTDKLSVEAGLEHFHSDFSGGSLWSGYFWDPKVPSYYEGGSNKWNTKLGLNYKAADHLLLYASFGQGFRDGGINSGLSDSCVREGAPHYYQPDTLNNFEVGWKSVNERGNFLWNGAVYYMPWRNYQTAVFDLSICPSTFNANLGDARIYGAESNVEYKASEGLTLQASASYNDSRLTSNSYLNPYYVVEPGERLPYVPYFNYSANGRYEHPLNAVLNGYAQLDIAHKGDMWSDLRVVDRHGFGRSLQPAYNLVNLRVGLNPPTGAWETELYVSNLGNTRADIFTNTGNYDHRQTTNEPRVFGVRLKYRFGEAE